MKKIILAVLMLTVSLSVVGCSEGKHTVEEKSNTEAVSEKQSFMEGYIENLNESERENFILCFNTTKDFCEDLEKELKNRSFVGKYEFDPSAEEKIPNELKEICSFKKLTLCISLYGLKNVSMKVCDETVELSYNGYKFYPTEYTVFDIKDIVENINN